jgi:mRNA interferase RelE/StbE
MAKYKIVLRESVSKDLRKVPSQDVERILAKIDLLADNPRPPGSEKLSGDEKYRVRQGNYRILYEIADERVLVTIVKVGQRGDVYRKA